MIVSSLGWIQSAITPCLIHLQLSKSQKGKDKRRVVMLKHYDAQSAII